MSESRESFLMLFYLLNLFEGPFIILFSCNGLQHDSGARSAKAKIMINSKSMSITVILNNSPSCII